ncbi:hypothetical protein KP509_25G055500 [Ceratopteris richardii]|uniref:Reverse transcriptase domain-containing protein n=1 Tax=Ceratopteris richardii TaxID=49495 RepID=A0A8T2RQK7_CERRI|nr:hypothetical protein KP509_25G055500 [Ceratopteris richardii]
MQDVIRDCGKYFSNVLRAAKVEAEHVIFSLTEKVDMGLSLSQREYLRLCDAYSCLHIAENNAIHSAKVRARCMEVNDLQASSKCFFDFLHAKRAANTISLLDVEDKELRDGNSIADACSNHFKKLFNASYSIDDSWFMALHDALRHAPQCLDSRMAASCETSITEEEIFLALGSLKNEKAPGLDGLTKEFVLLFWPSLKTLLLDVCNEMWMTQRIPYSFKQGKIKLIPKVDMPKQIGDWRPISMVNIIYKIFAKILALRLKPLIHKVVHPAQIGFIHKRSIYDNILTTQILMEHALDSGQEVVGIQINFEKAFDRRSVRQGCPLSPLFYAMASTLMFYLLQAKMESGFIHSVSLHGSQHIAVGFANDTFLFAKACGENIQKILTSLTPFSEASSLNINMGKSALINISAQHFHFPSWQGRKIDCGIIFRHLGYLLGINVSTKDQIQWMLCTIRNKLNLWHAPQWPLHIRIRIVQSFLQPYIIYYILLLIKNFLSNKAHNRALSKGGLGILNLHSHMMARQTAFIMGITSLYKPLWTEIFWKIMDNAEVYYKGIWKLNIRNKFFSHATLQTSSPTLSMLVRSFKQTASLLKWNGWQRYLGNSFASITKWFHLVLFLQQFQIPLSIDASQPWRDWLFAKHTRWWNSEAKTFYLSLLDGNDITSQCNFRWKLDKMRAWWHARFSTIWDSYLTFKMKVFMWRIVVGHFTLGAFLSKHGTQGVRCPHCASYAETMCHAFWSCSYIQRWWSSLFLFPIWDSKPSKFCSTFLLFDSSNAAFIFSRKFGSSGIRGCLGIRAQCHIFLGHSAN